MDLPGGGDQPTSGVLTWYVKGGKVRIDMSFEQAGQQASTIIKTEEGFFMCSDPQCLKFPAGLGQSQDMSQMLTGPLDEMKKSAQEVQTRSAGKRSIAGTKASCFEANITDGQGLFCLSDEGVPLLTEFQSGAAAPAPARSRCESHGRS